MNEPRPPAERASASKGSRRTGAILVAVLLLLLALGAGRTVMSRMASAKSLQDGTQERAIQYVKTVTAKTGVTGQQLSLPGTLQGAVQAPLGARATGYVKRWTKDIGARVQKGELLAEIETPEIGQQISQAVAAREQAAAGLALATSTVARWEGLRQKDVVSQQELDERRSGLAQARANVAAAEANVQRLRQTESFRNIVAPFAGVITRRNVDVGDLIDAGGARPLFVLTQTDPLRLYVNVPQAYSQIVKPGQKVTVTQAELPGQRFSGEVARTGASIDAATRTMQVEIALPNREGLLLPGAYVQVALPLPPGSGMTVLTNVLIFRGTGVRVAVVDRQGVVALRPIKVGRNFGDSVEVTEGVGPHDSLVLNPADSIAEGDKVAIAPPDAPASAASAAVRTAL